MANNSSAKKAIRKIAKRTEVNKNRISRVRTFVKKAEAAVGFKNPATAQTTDEAMVSVVAAEVELMKAANKGVMHVRTAARKVSRLVKRAKAISQ